jgi:hypothetical protein
LIRETIATRALLRTVTNADCDLFRPPHGKLSLAKLVGLWAIGQRVALWNVDPGDVFQPSADALLAWFDANPPESGDIILFHDRSEALAAALPSILALVRRRGLRFATISEWMRRPGMGVSINPGGVR